MSLPRSLWPADVFRWSVGTATAVPRRVLDLLSAAESVVAKAASLVDRTEKVVGDAEEAVGEARRITAAAQEQLTATRPLIEFMEEFSAHELQAAVKLVDELPRLARHVDEDILPILGTLNQVGPDLHNLLEVANDVRQAVLGIPGFDFLRRRGEGKDADSSDEDSNVHGDEKPGKDPEGRS
ncbi:hypothetical protein [Actinophytocola sp.]|uniref:hypothetical protein n=1 Tax=Actinophytocola sp. TaxID=1872138 RepID=UPI00389A72A6